VQSLDRAFAILETMADAGGIIGLSQLAEKADLPLATIHRLVRTLVDLGYVRQEASRQYSLGPRLMRLSDRRLQARRCVDPPGDDRRGGEAGGVGQPGHPRR
jgi:DNA-binding IclR family transcriptional regulator